MMLADLLPVAIADIVERQRRGSGSLLLDLPLGVLQPAALSPLHRGDWRFPLSRKIYGLGAKSHSGRKASLSDYKRTRLHSRAARYKIIKVGLSERNARSFSTSPDNDKADRVLHMPA
jgi:hypothetical protein